MNEETIKQIFAEKWLSDWLHPLVAWPLAESMTKAWLNTPDDVLKIIEIFCENTEHWEWISIDNLSKVVSIQYDEFKKRLLRAFEEVTLPQKFNNFDESIEHLPKNLKQEVINNLISTRWKAIKQWFKNHTWNLFIEFHNEESNIKNIEYIHNIENPENRIIHLYVDWKAYQLTNKDNLFYFFSETIQKNIVSSRFHSREVNYKYIDPRYKNEWVWTKEVQELPIKTWLSGFAYNINGHSQRIVDQIELILQFEEKLPKWFYCIIWILANSDDSNISEQITILTEKYNIKDIPNAMQVIMSYYEEIMETIAPWIERGIVNQLRSSKSDLWNQTKAIWYEDMKEQEFLSPNFEHISDFHKLLVTFLNSWEFMPYFHQEIAYDLRNMYENFQKLINSPEAIESQTIIAQLFSWLLSIDIRIRQADTIIQMEQDVLEIRPIAQETPAFRAITQLMSNNWYLYDRRNLEETQALLENIKFNLPEKWKKLKESIYQKSLELIDKLINKLKKKNPYKDVANWLSTALSIKQTSISQEELLQLEADFLLLKLYFTEKKVDPRLFNAIASAFERNNYIYSPNLVEETKRLIKEAFASLGNYSEEIIGSINLWIFNNLIKNLTEYFDIEKLTKMFEIYMSQDSKEWYKKYGRKILLYIHPDKIPEKIREKITSSEAYKELVKTFTWHYTRMTTYATA